MIKFKSRVGKIIFWVAYSLLTLFFPLLVTSTYLEPDPSMALALVLVALVMFLLVRSLLLAVLFTRFTPRIRWADKQTRYGVWIPIGTVLVLGILPTVLTSVQRTARCDDIGPGGTLWRCDLWEAGLSGLDLHGSDITGFKLGEADLSGCNLCDTTLVDAGLSDSSLVGADLTNAQLVRADLTGADLTGADATDARLQRADLKGADLAGAVLNAAAMGFADLVGAQGLTEESPAHLKSWESMRLRDEDEVLAQLWQVCDGKGVDGAAEYSPGRNANSFLLITDEGEKHPIHGGDPVYGSYWLPESVSNTELVACFDGPTRVAIGFCSYDDGTPYTRYGQRVDISIRLARTGALLKKLTFEGPRPNPCPEKKVAVGEHSDSVGKAPSRVPMIEALAPRFNEDGVRLPPNLP